MKKIILLSVFLLVGGCASSVMKQYVGKDIREVYLEHGKPNNEFNLQNGQRVFQFNWGESSAGSPYGQKGGCLLSYITERDEKNDTWIVVEYKFPNRLIC
jgi:hypothetical protein